MYSTQKQYEQPRISMYGNDVMAHIFLHPMKFIRLLYKQGLKRFTFLNHSAHLRETFFQGFSIYHFKYFHIQIHDQLYLILIMRIQYFCINLHLFNCRLLTHFLIFFCQRNLLYPGSLFVLTTPNTAPMSCKILTFLSKKIPNNAVSPQISLSSTMRTKWLLGVTGQ